MLLAGDIGGTKTLLGLFEADAIRPRARLVREFGTLEFIDLTSMIRRFLDAAEAPRAAVACACFGVAGPVLGDSATLTNVPWRVEGRAVADAFGIAHVHLLNDLEAMAWSIPVLSDSEVHVLQQGVARAEGNIALIAAGTGLGQALLHRVHGRFVPAPSEGGHADFAARTEREISLLRDLTSRYGRAGVEHVVSGRGFANLFRIAHAEPCSAGVDGDLPDGPALISSAALEHRCRGCEATLAMFVDAYGAEAGNLALRTVSTGGVFIGGGIAPKILPALTDGAFVRAFLAKPPLDQLLAKMPVKIILNPRAGLLGAAVFAAAQC